MSNIALYKADSRGKADYGWLKTRYSFSFAQYFDAQRLQFGQLRVLNDDFIAGGGGFTTHPHDNMEIITVVLSGALAHKDSMGHTQVINENEVQVMSAGTGITHSEFNASATEPVTLFQIWIYPNKQNLTPQYNQRTFNPALRHNRFQTLVSPNQDADELLIHQDAWLMRGVFDSGRQIDYVVKKQGNGLFMMVIDGVCSISGQKLLRRDAIEISEVTMLGITANADNTDILLIDVSQ